MAKVYFRYGVMGSSKSMNLLAVAHNYEVVQKKPVIVFKPSTDTRDKEISSRTGISRKADLIITPHFNDISGWFNSTKPDCYCVLVDEAQFLTEKQVLELTKIADDFDIPVIAYGLKTNFRNNFKGFEGSEALLRWADKIEEIKTVCYKETCNRKAIHNMRLVNGEPSFEGDSVVIGDIEEQNSVSYLPVCRPCYKQALESSLSKRLFY